MSFLLIFCQSCLRFINFIDFFLRNSCFTDVLCCFLAFSFSLFSVLKIKSRRQKKKSFCSQFSFHFLVSTSLPFVFFIFFMSEVVLFFILSKAKHPLPSFASVLSSGVRPYSVSLLTCVNLGLDIILLFVFLHSNSLRRVSNRSASHRYELPACPHLFSKISS